MSDRAGELSRFAMAAITAALDETDGSAKERQMVLAALSGMTLGMTFVEVHESLGVEDARAVFQKCIESAAGYITGQLGGKFRMSIWDNMPKGRRDATD